MKTRLLLVLFFSFVCITMIWGQQRDCPYCKGTGKMVKNISGPQYGLKKEAKVKCPECGIYYLPSTGHSHIHCKYCRGTGKIGNDTNRSSSERESYYDPNSPTALLANQIVLTALYGLPVSEEESKALETFSIQDQDAARKYVEWRNTLNIATIYFNQSRDLLRARGTTVQALDSYRNNVEEQLSKYVTNTALSYELCQISQKLYQEYENAFNSYRKYVVGQQSIDIMRDQLWDMQLNQLLF